MGETKIYLMTSAWISNTMFRQNLFGLKMELAGR